QTRSSPCSQALSAAVSSCRPSPHSTISPRAQRGPSAARAEAWDMAKSAARPIHRSKPAPIRPPLARRASFPRLRGRALRLRAARRNSLPRKRGRGGGGGTGGALAEAVLVHLLVGARVPEPAIVGADLVGDDDADLVIGIEAAELELEVDEADADPEEEAGQEVVDPERNLHDLVEVVGAGPAKGGDVLLGDQRIAQLVLLQIIFNDRARQRRPLGDTKPLGERSRRDIAHDDPYRDDLDLAHKLLAHV